MDGLYSNSRGEGEMIASASSKTSYSYLRGDHPYHNNHYDNRSLQLIKDRDKREEFIDDLKSIPNTAPTDWTNTQLIAVVIAAAAIVIVLLLLGYIFQRCRACMCQKGRRNDDDYDSDDYSSSSGSSSSYDDNGNKQKEEQKVEIDGSGYYRGNGENTNGGGSSSVPPDYYNNLQDILDNAANEGKERYPYDYHLKPPAQRPKPDMDNDDVEYVVQHHAPPESDSDDDTIDHAKIMAEEGASVEYAEYDDNGSYGNRSYDNRSHDNRSYDNRSHDNRSYDRRYDGNDGRY